MRILSPMHKNDGTETPGVDIPGVAISVPWLDHFVTKWTNALITSMDLPVAEATVIGSAVQRFRGRSGRCNAGVNVFVAFWGFAPVIHRNTMLRGLRYALRPRVIYASQKKSVDGARSQYFEGMMCYQPNVMTIEQLEEFLERFHMSIGVADLDTLMSDAMLTCVSRVQAGEYVFGNWYTSQNTYYRSEHIRRSSQKAEREARQNLLRVTGMHLSTSNMLSLFYDRQNLHIDAQHRHSQLSVVRTILDAEESVVGTTLQLATRLPETDELAVQIRQEVLGSLNRNEVLRTHIENLMRDQHRGVFGQRITGIPVTGGVFGMVLNQGARPPPPDGPPPTGPIPAGIFLGVVDLT